MAFSPVCACGFILFFALALFSSGQSGRAELLTADKHHDTSLNCTDGKIGTSPTGRFSCLVNNNVSLYINPANATNILVRFDQITLDDEDEVILMFNHTNTTQTILGPWKGTHDPFDAITNLKGELVIAVIVDSAKSKKSRRITGSWASECFIKQTQPKGTYNLPVYRKLNDTTTKCTIDISVNGDLAITSMFEEFNIGGNSSVDFIGAVEKETFSYNKNRKPDIDILGGSSYNISLTLDQTVENQSIIITFEPTLKECSQYYNVQTGSDSKVPALTLPNKTDDIKNLKYQSVECRWLLKGQVNDKLGASIEYVKFLGSQDNLVINDGGKKSSPTLLQASRANLDQTKGLYIRTSSLYLWISVAIPNFSPDDQLNIKVNAPSVGGHYADNGSIDISSEQGQDGVYLLEGKPGKQILLSLSSGPVGEPTYRINIYSDFYKDSPLIASLGTDDAVYPVVSPSNKMMIIAKNVPQNKVKANFSSIEPGCHSVSFKEQDFYTLTEKCPGNCSWVINSTNKHYINLQLSNLNLGPKDTATVSSLKSGSNLVIYKLNSTSGNVPPILLPGSKNVIVKVDQNSCSANASANKVILKGSYSLTSVCQNKISLKSQQGYKLMSPGYPNVYPLNSDCTWDFSSDNGLYISFKTVDIQESHTLVFTHGNHSLPIKSDRSLPADLVYDSKDISVKFNAPFLVNSPYKSGYGFYADIQAIDCGSSYSSDNGSVHIPALSGQKGQLCFYKIHVGNASSLDKDNVTAVVVQFKIQLSNKTENVSDLVIYDGNSTRSRVITNMTAEVDFLSRYDTILIKYQVPKNVTAQNITISYVLHKCSKACTNPPICMHDDWVCNGVNDCGDNSDELDCSSQPSPTPPTPPPTGTPAPSQKSSGVSPVAFGLVVPLAFILGILATVFVPVLIKRYRGNRYSEFRNVDVTD